MNFYNTILEAELWFAAHRKHISKRVRKLGTRYGYSMLVVLLLGAIAVGSVWSAWESHVANLGVYAWQHQMGELMQQGGPGR